MHGTGDRLVFQRTDNLQDAHVHRGAADLAGLFAERQMFRDVDLGRRKLGRKSVDGLREGEGQVHASARLVLVLSPPPLDSIPENPPRLRSAVLVRILPLQRNWCGSVIGSGPRDCRVATPAPVSATATAMAAETGCRHGPARGAPRRHARAAFAIEVAVFAGASGAVTAHPGQAQWNSDALVRAAKSIPHVTTGDKALYAALGVTEEPPLEASALGRGPTGRPSKCAAYSSSACGCVLKSSSRTGRRRARTAAPPAFGGPTA